jgi:3-deoxy-manno-octulosonate cytidylyltransferase (CMP-KDO synthetase)
LLDFAKLPSTPLEKLESVDMLRLIEHGYRVKMVRTEFNTQAVDTQADLERVAILMKADSFVDLY